MSIEKNTSSNSGNNSNETKPNSTYTVPERLSQLPDYKHVPPPPPKKEK